MTILEAHTALDIEINKLNTAANMHIKREQKDYCLYVGMVNFIKSRYRPNNQNKEGFEQSEKRIEDLAGLVKSDIRTVGSLGVETYGTLFSLPSDYWYTVRAKASITYTDCKGNQKTKTVKVVPSTHDEWETIKDSPFGKSWQEKLTRLTYQGGHEVIAFEDCTINNYTIVYIKKPKILIYDISEAANSLFNISGQLNLASFTETFELHDSTHLEIIQEATVVAKGIIEHKSFQTQINSLLKQD